MDITEGEASHVVFQTDPRGVEAGETWKYTCPSCGFRRTLVGLKRRVENAIR